MVALLWIISVLTNILNPIGLISACFMLSEGDTEIFSFPIVMGVIGIVFGFLAWGYTVAPRMFWVSSRLGLFENRIGCALGYGLSFFNSTVAVMVLMDMFL